MAQQTEADDARTAAKEFAATTSHRTVGDASVETIGGEAAMVVGRSKAHQAARTVEKAAEEHGGRYRGERAGTYEEWTVLFTEGDA